MRPLIVHLGLGFSEEVVDITLLSNARGADLIDAIQEMFAIRPKQQRIVVGDHVICDHTKLRPLSQWVAWYLLGDVARAPGYLPLELHARLVKLPRACNWCGSDRPEDVLLRCAGCRKTRYCSTSCQKRDWTHQHKQQCTPIAMDVNAPIDPG